MRTPNSMLRHFVIMIASGRAVLHESAVPSSEIDIRFRMDGYYPVNYSLIGDYDLLYEESMLIGICFVSEILPSTSFAKCSNVQYDGEYFYFLFCSDANILCDALRIDVVQCVGASCYIKRGGDNAIVVIPAWESHAESLAALTTK